jgi:hypothetical protein
LIVGEATRVNGLDNGLKTMCWLYSILPLDIVQSCQRIESIAAAQYTSTSQREGREKRQHYPRRRRAGVFAEMLLTGRRSSVNQSPKDLCEGYQCDSTRQMSSTRHASQARSSGQICRGQLTVCRADSCRVRRTDLPPECDF